MGKEPHDVERASGGVHRCGRGLLLAKARRLASGGKASSTLGQSHRITAAWRNKKHCAKTPLVPLAARPAAALFGGALVMKLWGRAGQPEVVGKQRGRTRPVEAGRWVENPTTNPLAL